MFIADSFAVSSLLARGAAQARRPRYEEPKYVLHFGVVQFSESRRRSDRRPACS